MKKLIFAGLTLFTLGAANAVMAANYYVDDTGGSDGNSGTFINT